MRLKKYQLVLFLEFYLKFFLTFQYSIKFTPCVHGMNKGKFGIPDPQTTNLESKEVIKLLQEIKKTTA